MSHAIHSVVRHYRTVRRVIIICLSKNREHNGHNKKEQKDKKDSAKHTYKTEDRVTRSPLKTGMNAGAPEV